MKKSKLVEILGTYSPSEIKTFEKFIASPYFSRGRDVSGLYSYLKSYYPGFESKFIKKETVFFSLFPGEEYNEKKLKNLSFELAQLAEQFLISESLKKNYTEKAMLLAIEYKDRNKGKLFFNTLKIIEDKIAKKLFDSFDAFSMEEKILWLKQEYYIGINDYKEVISLKGKHTEYTMLSFLIKFLRALRDKEIVNSGYPGEMNTTLLDCLAEGFDIEKTIKLLKKEKFRFVWLIELYYLAYTSSKELDNEKAYFSFRKLYKENIGNFSKREKYYILSDFLSFCVRNQNRGKSNYQSEEMTLYKEMVRQDAFCASEDDHLNIVLFRNILFMALSLDEDKWFEENRSIIVNRLRPELKENAEYYAIAHLEYEKGNYEKALENINKVKYDVFLYKIDVKNLLLKIFFELKQYDQAFSLVDAYKHFLKSNKELSHEYKEQFLNFIIMYNKILRTISQNKPENQDFLLSELKSIKTISNRDWLTEKINNLKNK